MERVSIFEPCVIEYEEYDKPVKYTEEFLKEIASNTISSKISNEHYGDAIGTMSNFTFTDGKLFADADSSESLKKFSPSFEDFTLVEEEDYLIATGGRLVEVASTINPRLDNGGSNMAEEDKTKEFLANEVERLQKEIAKRDVVIERNKEKLSSFNEMETELTSLRELKENNEKLINEQKPIVEKYNNWQSQQHEKLLETVSNGNPELKEKFKEWSTEQLQTMIETKLVNQPAKGVGTENAPGLNQGTEKKGKEYSADEFKAQYEELTGNKSTYFD